MYVCVHSRLIYCVEKYQKIHMGKFFRIVYVGGICVIWRGYDMGEEIGYRMGERI